MELTDKQIRNADVCEHCGHTRVNHRNERGACFTFDVIGHPCLCSKFKLNKILSKKFLNSVLRSEAHSGR